MDNAKTYFEESYAWARGENVEIVYFSQMNELWKVEGSKGDIGMHWGHFTAGGLLKEAYAGIYESISPKPVTDTPAWAEREILELILKGIIGVSEPGYYMPNNPIQRGEILHALMNSLGLDGLGSGGSTFADVGPAMYYYYTIGAGQKAGLIQGVGDNLCQPLRDISRQELFLIVYRSMVHAGFDLKPNRELLTHFSDGAAVADWAADGISALIAGGIVLGDHNGNINPTSPATRAESAMLIYRIYDKTAKSA